MLMPELALMMPLPLLPKPPLMLMPLVLMAMDWAGSTLAELVALALAQALGLGSGLSLLYTWIFTPIWNCKSDEYISSVIILEAYSHSEFGKVNSIPI